MQEKRLAIVGASGRMGQEISQIIENLQGWSVSSNVGRSEGMLSHPSKLDAKALDAVVDFSSIDIFKDVVDWCVEHKKYKRK